MPFTVQSLRVHMNEGFTGASPDGKLSFREATYVTTDAPAVVEAAGYFNAGVQRLPYGTIIEALMTFDPVTPSTPKYKEYIVTGNDGAIVTIGLQTVTAG